MNLSRPEELLIKAISAAVRDEHLSAETEILADDRQALFMLARQHNILPLVYEAVSRANWGESAKTDVFFRQITMNQVGVQAIKTAAFLDLYDDLVKKGFHPLVVKGIVCRSMYPRGDYRISSDEDLLIPDAEWEACCREMFELGFEPTDGYIIDRYEIGFRKDLLHIELHHNLFSNDSPAFSGMNAFFADAHERATDYYVEDGRTVRSLSPHDSLLFLLLHAYKHFIHSGFGIRQVCDVGLWTMCYRNEIDWLKLRDQLKSVYALKFSAALLSLSRSCLDIENELPPEFAEIETDPEPMLLDLLEGGVYGASSMSRIHSATGTVNAVNASRSNKRASVWRSVFPTAKSLQGRYPELKKHPLRLPLVWAKRLFGYLKEKRSSRHNSVRKSMKIIKERKALLHLYGII